MSETREEGEFSPDLKLRYLLHLYGCRVMRGGEMRGTRAWGGRGGLLMSSVRCEVG